MFPYWGNNVSGGQNAPKLGLFCPLFLFFASILAATNQINEMQ